MPVAHFTPEEPSLPPNKSPFNPTGETVYVAAEPFDPNYGSIALDTKFQDQPATISHLEGSPWVVDMYLSQILKDDSQSQGQQVTTHAIHQQYHAIMGMELRQQGALSHSQDSKSKDSTYTGSSSVFPFLIPNKGDMIVTRLFDGAVGIFELTRSEKLSPTKDSAHSIDYILVGRNDKIRYDDLIRKIQRRSFFNRDFLYHGQNPLLTEESFNTMEFFVKTHHQYCKNFFDSFFSVEYATLLIPNQPVPSYDKFLVQTMLSLVEQQTHDRIKYIRNLNTQEDTVMQSRSIWDVFVTRDRNAMHDIFKQVGGVSAKSFNAHQTFEPIRYSGIGNVVYPKDPPYHVDASITGRAKPVYDDLIGNDEKTAAFESFKKKQQAYRDSLLQDGETSVAVTDEDVYRELGIKPVFDDDYYIFSKAFYENDSTPFAQSKLELMVNDYIDNKQVSWATLREVASTSYCWSAVERFYYLPIMIMLIRSVVRSL